MTQPADTCAETSDQQVVSIPADVLRIAVRDAQLRLSSLRDDLERARLDRDIMVREAGRYQNRIDRLAEKERIVERQYEELVRAFGTGS